MLNINISFTLFGTAYFGFVFLMFPTTSPCSINFFTSESDSSGMSPAWQELHVLGHKATAMALEQLAKGHQNSWSLQKAEKEGQSWS